MTPASETAACLGMIASIYLDLVPHGLRLRCAARPLVAGIDAVAGAVDGCSARLRGPGRGTLFANVNVLAEVPR